VLRNGLHTYATLTSLGENLQYLLIVSHERCKMEEGRRKMEDKKGWYAIEAYQPFYAFSK
jgi:hypothetical protein